MVTTFLGNSLIDWIRAGVVFTLVLVGLLTARRVIVGRLEAIAKKTTTDVDDFFVSLLRSIRPYLIVALALATAARVLVFPSGVTASVDKWIHVITQLAILLQVGLWGNALIAYWIRHWAERRVGESVSITTLAAFGALARVAVWLLLALFALRNTFGQEITPLITGLGIGGVAVALAVQNILGDIFAALAIVVDKPFLVGEAMTVGDLTGIVEHIGLKTTRLRSVNGEQLVFSNSDLLQSRMRNWSRMRERRVVFSIGVTYDTSPALARHIPDLVRDIVSATDKARFDRCHFVAYGDSSLNYEIVYWVTTPDYLDYRNTLHAVNVGILARFAEVGIEFAFPTRTLQIQSPERAIAADGAPQAPSSAPRA